MHEHNEEIIMALAENRLGAAEAAAAAAEIEACAQCSTDLEFLRVALDATARAPEVYLSATESSRLHESLHQELRLPSPAPTATQARPAWGRVAGWAFGLAAVFLGAVVLLPALTGGDDDAASDVIAAEAPEEGAATTAAAFQPQAEVAPEELDDVSMMAGGDSSADESAADSPLMAAETTASPETSDLAVIGEDGLTEEIRDEIVAALRLDSNAYRAADAAAKTTNLSYALCLEQTMADGYSAQFSPPDNSDPQLIGLVGDDTGAENLLIAYVPPNVEETAIASVSQLGCELVEALP